VGKKPKIPVPIESTINIGHLTGKRRGAIVKEEILHRGSEVVKYSLHISIRAFAESITAEYLATTIVTGIIIGTSRVKLRR
jgi:hypothetical protein